MIRKAVLVLLLLLPMTAEAQETRGPEETVEAMLTQVGGREVWAAARGFHMVEILNSASYELPLIREYWVDFESPRIMERTTGSTIHALQALNGESGWTLIQRTGEDPALTTWDGDTVAGWRGFWPGIPTRVFHLLASNDPSVEARLNGESRLDIFVDGTFAVWIAFDGDAKPIAYGREESHVETHFLGAYHDYGPVRLWGTAYEQGDQWSVTMVDYELIEGEMPVSYAEPSNLTDFNPAP